MKTMLTLLVSLSVFGLSANAQQATPKTAQLTYSATELVQINDANKALTRLLLEAAQCDYQTVMPTELWARALSYVKTAPEITSPAFDRVSNEDLTFMLNNKTRVMLFDATNASLKQVVQSMRDKPVDCDEAAFKQRAKLMDDTLLASGVERRLLRLQSLGLRPNF